jgi:cysteine synthase
MSAHRDPNKPLESILESIGDTPLLKLGRSVPEGFSEIFAKIEFFNPGGSIKDRVGLGMIEAAEEEGLLDKDSAVVEATTGNTAIGLAIVCAVKKYRLILVMPENYSREYHRLLAAYGAELILTAADQGMAGAVAKAQTVARETPKSFSPKQFKNRINPKVHREATAKEIMEEIPAGSIDAFVAGMGSGGTITGVGRALKESNPRLKIFGVESPEGLLGTRSSGKDSRITSEVLDRTLIDEVLSVSDAQAFQLSKELAREEGLMVGIESGVAFFGAREAARRLGKGKKVVTIFPDAGGRYFSLEKYFNKMT